MIEMFEAKVWVKEKNYELPVNEICPLRFRELVNHRVFKTLQDVQYTMLALSRGTKCALERGLACPLDTKNAIRYIETLEKY